MMRSESTRALGQPRLTKPILGAAAFAGMSFIGALIGETRGSVDGRQVLVEARSRSASTMGSNKVGPAEWRRLRSALAQELLDLGIGRLFGALLGRARFGVGLRLRRVLLAGALAMGSRLASATLAAPALFDLDVAEHAADRFADGLALELLLNGLADLVDGLSGLLRIGEHLLDLGTDGRPVERPLDAHRHGEPGKIVGAALSFRSRDDLGIGEEVHRALDDV